jgi:hypothetical protein
MSSFSEPHPFVTDREVGQLRIGCHIVNGG